MKNTRRCSPNKIIPEPPTLRDDYATRTDALHENQQRVFDDLTRRDLKLEPPTGLKGPERNQMAQRETDRGRNRRRRQEENAHRRGTEQMEISALHAGLPRLHPVGG